MPKKSTHGGKRPGAGRPPKTDTMTERITLFLPAAALRKLERRAKREQAGRKRISVGEAVRRAIDAYL